MALRSKLLGLFTLPLLRDTARPQREKARSTLCPDRELVSSQFKAPISSATAIAAIIPSPGPMSHLVRTSTIGAEQDLLTWRRNKSGLTLGSSTHLCCPTPQPRQTSGSIAEEHNGAVPVDQRPEGRIARQPRRVPHCHSHGVAAHPQHPLNLVEASPCVNLQQKNYMGFVFSFKVIDFMA